MKIILLAAGAAAMALSAGVTLAAPRKAATAMEPKQPIPYSQLNAYMKASPKVRMSKDWWAGQDTGAATGQAANTSATATAGSDVRSAPDASSSASPSSTTEPATSENPPSAGGNVNPATSLPATPPLDAGATTSGAVNPPATTPPK